MNNGDTSSTKTRGKIPTPFTTAAMIVSEPVQSTHRPRTPTATVDYPLKTYMNTSNDSKRFSPDSIYTFDRQTNSARSSRDSRAPHTPSARSKTPGPEFGSTTFHSAKVQPRSKTPTAADYSLSLQNSRSLPSVHRQYSEIVVNLTLNRTK